MKLMIALAAAAAAAALTSPASATPVEDTAIHYNDLDLSTTAGQKTLWGRVTAVERTLCSTNPITGSRIAPSNDDCKNSFREITKPQIEAAIAKAQKRVSDVATPHNAPSANAQN